MTRLPDNEYLFTSESVTEGHPDKIADQISDGVLDAVLREDPGGRVACETLVNTGLVVVSGEITTETYVDIQDIARETIRGIGYTDADLGLQRRLVRGHQRDRQAVARHRAGRRRRLRAAPRPGRRGCARRRRRRRPGDDVRLRHARDRRAHAAADLARAPPRPAAGRGAQGGGAALPAAGRQDPGDGPLPRRRPGGDREGPDLHPASRRRRLRVAHQARPVRARPRAGAARRPLRPGASCAGTSSSTRPAGS